MKIRFFLGILLAGLAMAQVSCITNEADDGPKPPESEPISSMPHNIPQSWEGQAGLPGIGTGGF